MLQLWRQFYEENKHQIHMPRPVNYPLNYKRAQQWADSHCDVESRDFAAKIIADTTYVPFGQFMERLRHICETYVEKASGSAAYVLILPFEVGKSNTWVSLLAFEWLAPIITDVYADITTAYNDTHTPGSPLHGKVVRCIVCDDCVYTGSQLVGAISTFDYDRVVFKAKKQPPDIHDRAYLKWYKETRSEVEDFVMKISLDEFSVDVVVPYISTLADARLHKIPYVRVSAHAYVFSIFGQKIDMDRMPIQIQKEFRRTFQYHKEISAIYFDHKIADAVSTFNKIYLLAPVFNCAAANKSVGFVDGCGAAELPPGMRAAEYYPDLEKKVNSCPPTFYKHLAYTLGGVVVDQSRSLFGAPGSKQSTRLPGDLGANGPPLPAPGNDT